MKNFYYVYNRAQGKPLKRHKDVNKAIDEAARLCKLTNKNFYVLTPVAHVLSDRDGGIAGIETIKKGK